MRISGHLPVPLMPSREQGELRFRFERLRQLMDERGMNNLRLSHEVGANPGTVGRWFPNPAKPEEKPNLPSLEFIAKVAKLFGVSQAELLEGIPTSAAATQIADVARQLDDLRLGQLLERARTLLEEQNRDAKGTSKAAPLAAVIAATIANDPGEFTKDPRSRQGTRVRRDLLEKAQAKAEPSASPGRPTNRPPR